jgi:hypothetical protein
VLQQMSHLSYVIVMNKGKSTFCEKSFGKQNVFSKFQKFSKKARFLIGPKIDLTKEENYYRPVRLNLAIPTLISLFFLNHYLKTLWRYKYQKMPLFKKITSFCHKSPLDCVAEILRLFHKNSSRQGAHAPYLAII